MSRLTISVSEKIATITLRRPASLNAMTVEDYADLANSLREVDQRKDVLVTVVQGVCSMFSMLRLLMYLQSYDSDRKVVLRVSRHVPVPGTRLKSVQRHRRQEAFG
jgi:enoyl-CoA hydratase/carnithine racemase